LAVTSTLIARFNTTTNTWSALGTGGGNGVNNQVYAIAISGNDVYVGGAFTTANSGTAVAANYIARFNTITNRWSALGSGGGNGVNNIVRAIAISGNDVFAGGLFTQANVGGAAATAKAANCIARFNTRTNMWAAMTGAECDSGNGVNSTVYAIAIAGSDVFLGGAFTTGIEGGTEVAANYMACFNMTSKTWAAMTGAGGGGVHNQVTAIAISGNDVFLGGAFTTASEVTANSFARFNTKTKTWSALGTGE